MELSQCRKLSSHQNLRSRSELVKGPPDEDRSGGDDGQSHGSTVEFVTLALAVSLIMLLGIFICNRLTSRCTIKIPPPGNRRVLRGDHLESQESTFQLLHERV
ncbi:hypothetical protein HPB50_019313 [Hyalomma asiaticum]|uniref:Uncharacterized protein n=1 Tax=Hyalomma asiaticum TaxID=266040 RepID=A0ACB7RK44_HYAAI|nr:hypothetical protein HPB50_019313 [Hyalomma asiaticum]